MVAGVRPPTIAVWRAVTRSGGLAGLPWRTGVLLLPVLLMTFVRPFIVPTDPDYWWHVATGRLIVTTGTIPRVDPYSYTVTGQAWTAHEWLTEVLFYVTSVQAGYVGTVVLFALVGSATAVLLYATCRLRGLGELPATILTLWGSLMGIASFNVRPQALTALFLALVAWMLTRYLQRLATPLWLLPPLFVLWVNLHGGYVIGLALLALTLGGQTLSFLQRRSSVPLQPLILVTICSAAATLLNPHGLRELLYPLSYLAQGNDSLQFIAEWQSPNFHQPIYLPYAISIMLVMVLGLWRSPLGWTEMLWAVTFTLLSLQSARHVPLDAIVVMPLIASRLSAELPILQASPVMLGRPVLLYGLGLLSILLTLFTAGQADATTGLQIAMAPNASGYPAGAIDYLQAHQIRGNLFNDYDWGGYLIYRLYPGRPVFIDGRADVYSGAPMHNYTTVVRLSSGWQQVLDRYGVSVVLMPSDSPLVAALQAQPGWRTAYSDGLSALLVRQP